MLKAPRYGYGNGMNPCIDCHALMVRRAGEYLKEIQADFLFTGEVLGQRPFSQTKPSFGRLKRIRRSGPYPSTFECAPFEETKQEQEGLVDRFRLLDILGRSRKRQIAWPKDMD